MLLARLCGKAEMAGKAGKPFGRGCRRRCNYSKSSALLLRRSPDGGITIKSAVAVFG